ncbi:MAG: hypothetical protein LBK53_01080 [Heliobacteriaceae bacterium]|jgi:hypothetical protein|nr:hypothetical protein [Heliobacteriaceae bacterium]
MQINRIQPNFKGVFRLSDRRLYEYHDRDQELIRQVQPEVEAAGGYKHFISGIGYILVPQASDSYMRARLAELGVDADYSDNQRLFYEVENRMGIVSRDAREELARLPFNLIV